MPAKFREIVKSPQCEKEAEDLLGSVERVDDFFRGLEWALSKDPFCGQNLEPNSPIWVITSAPAGIETRIVVYYTFSDVQVFLMSAIES